MLNTIETQNPFGTSSSSSSSMLKKIPSRHNSGVFIEVELVDVETIFSIEAKQEGSTMATL